MKFLVFITDEGKVLTVEHPFYLHRRIQQQIAQQQAYFNNIHRPSYYGSAGGGGSYSTPNRYAPNHAAAAASIGPGGSYHTASINPANPVKKP